MNTDHLDILRGLGRRHCCARRKRSRFLGRVFSFFVLKLGNLMIHTKTRSRARELLRPARDRRSDTSHGFAIDCSIRPACEW